MRFEHARHARPAKPTTLAETNGLWSSLLVVHLALLAGLVTWVVSQSRPVVLAPLDIKGGKLKCLSYAPFHRPGQTPFDQDLRIPLAQIEDDLAALSKTTECVRLYSVDMGLDQVPAVARKLGLKVLLGAWIGSDREAGALELDRAVKLADANADVVRALIVGNEVLLRRERSEEQMRALLREVKSRTTVPVTYADVWEFWTRHDSLAKEVDFVTVHILPFWEDEPVDIDHAQEHVATIRARVEQHFAGKQILIGETGWPSQGRQRACSRPSRVNQARYVREFVRQADEHGWDYNLIEAIDQPWKRGLEGTVGGYWGVLDAHTLAPKFPLSSYAAVAERASPAAQLTAAALGAVGGVMLALKNSKVRSKLRMCALAAMGSATGIIALCHAEHARVAYRGAFELTILGFVALVSASLPALFAFRTGAPIPAAAQAWYALTSSGKPIDGAGLGIDYMLGLARAMVLFAAAVAATLLFFDPRYRDFPTLLYLTPAALFGVDVWYAPRHARAERTMAAVIAGGVVGRWLPEPANPQAVGWMLTGLGLAGPMLALEPIMM